MKFAARVLCLGVKFVSGVYKEAQGVGNHWTPCPRRGATVQASPPDLEAGSLAKKPEEDDFILRSLVRSAIGNAAEGRSYRAYVREAQRFAVAFEHPGPRYMSPTFAYEVAALASMVLRELDALDFNQRLPGLDIPSDFGILGDPVSMGESILCRSDVLLVLCLSLVSARNGRLYNPMHSARAMPIGSHAGHAMADLFLEALLDHPAAWGLFSLRARAAVVGGDGGLCLGGPDHRHGSPAAAEKLWRLIHPDPEAPMCTSWDPFHRTDIAVWRAVRKHAAIIAIFDMAKEIDYLFGQSEGVVIFRAVAAAIDENVHRISAPGGTRKVVYLSSVPGSLVSNYKTIRASLWARVEWTQAGRSTQPLAKLMDLGRRLSGVGKAVHMVCLQDVLMVIVRPFAKQVQGNVEPCSFLAGQTAVLEKIRRARKVLRRTRVLLRVVSLCRQHAVPEDLVRLVEAHNVGQTAAAFPTLFENIPFMLGAECRFQGCALETRDAAPAHDGSQQMLLGSHCQCASLLAHRASARTGRDGGRLGPPSPPTVPHPRRVGCRLVVPAWVAFGRGMRPMEGDLVNAEPRCDFRARGLSAPTGCSTLGMFRNRIYAHQRRTSGGGSSSTSRAGSSAAEHSMGRIVEGLWVGPGDGRRHRCVPIKWGGLCPCGWTSTCQISHRSFVADCEINAALAEIEDFLATLADELSQILGSVGMNDDMAELLVNAARCWDWSRLLVERPQLQDVVAFRCVAAVLGPCLRHTIFPVDPAFHVVPRSWPEADILDWEYMLLCRRVRQAAAAARRPGARDIVPEEVAKAADSWVVVGTLDVVPLWVCGGWFAVLGQLWRKWSVGSAHDRLRWSSRVCLFAGGPRASPLPPTAFEVWRLPLDRLSQYPPQRVRRKCGEEKGAWVPGRIVTLWPCARRQGRGKLVEVVGVVRKVDVVAVSAALDMFSWFSVGSAPVASAWGSNRVRHRCRHLFAPDSCCESMGSLMRLLWSQRRAQISPAQLVDSVFLSQAAVACVGEPRDEMIVAEVTKLLQSTSRYKMRTTSVAGTHHTPEHIAALGERLRASGRACRDLPGTDALPQPSGFDGVDSAKSRRAFLRQRREESRPTELPPVMAQAVQRCARKGKVVPTLALDVPELHARQKGATVSALRQKEAEWQRRWQEEKRLLTLADDPEEPD